MKKSLSTGLRKRAALLLAVLLFFLSASLTLAAEKIDHYAVNIELKRDATFSVEETIIYDFGNEYRHGVYRTIPTKHEQASSGLFKKRYTDFSNIEVKMDGVSVPVSTKNSWGELEIRIGDPDKTITGKHTYTITYDVAGGLQYYENGAPELYWDAIGTEWSAPIGGATVSVTAPSGMLTGSSACYAGGSTSANSCGEPTRIQNGYQYRIGNLGANQGVTVAFALEGSVPTVVLEKTNLSVLLIPTLLLALFGAIFGGYRYKTRFKTGNPIIAQYEPYPGVKPMYTGLLMDGRLDPKDITACIVYLAQQGYLKIKKTDTKVLFFFEVDDYEIELVNAPGAEASSFQQEILSLLFSTRNPGETVALSDLKTNHSKQRANQKILTRLRKDLMKDLKNEGYYQALIIPWGNKLLWLVTGMVLIIAFLFPLILIIGVPLFLVFAKRRTRKGYEALDHLKGFKDFLQTTEAERYKFHNAPTKSPEQFMEYLPYAIALGVEKEWAEVFKDITIPDPGWYDGGTTGTAFSATNLTTSLGSFSAAFASSSGSSGGSGGGGSVGGGGGGGGGGSW